MISWIHDWIIGTELLYHAIDKRLVKGCTRANVTECTHVITITSNGVVDIFRNSFSNHRTTRKSFLGPIYAVLRSRTHNRKNKRLRTSPLQYFSRPWTKDGCFLQIHRNGVSLSLREAYNDKVDVKLTAINWNHRELFLAKSSVDRKKRIIRYTSLMMGFLLLHHAKFLQRITKACQRLSNFYFLRTSGFHNGKIKPDLCFACLLKDFNYSLS